MTLADNKSRIIDEWIPATVRRDRGKILSMLTEDAVNWLPKSMAPTLSRPQRGREDVAALYLGAERFMKSETRQWDYRVVMAEGDHVFVLANLTAITQGDLPFESEFAFIYRFENGLIAELWQQFDTKYCAELQPLIR